MSPKPSIQQVQAERDFLNNDRISLWNEREALVARLERAVDSLFVNGQGERADRLVLTRDGMPPSDLGGWCRGAIVERLAAALTSTAPEAAR